MIQTLSDMGPKIFFAIIIFSVFSYLLVDATRLERTRDEEAYAKFQPSDYFSNLEYDLVINADGTSFDSNYWGRVYITMKCRKKTNKIFLDQKSISINAETIEAWEHKTDDRKITVHYGRDVSEGEGYKIKLEEYMQVDVTYEIRLEFSKSIFSEKVGFVSEYYRLSHPTLSYNPKEYLNRLSNFDMEILESTFCEDKCGESTSDLPKIWAVDEFEKTHLISTFSMALAVVKYNSYGPSYQKIGPSGTDYEIVEMKIWAEEDILREHQLEELLTIAGQSLDFFSDFFNSKYNLGKLDLIILPDKDIIVQDNYGLIYLGENAVKNVFKESTHYRTDRYLMVSKICQSMSRQWIGHLVSLSDWQEEWFYDGLHSYLERLCVLKMFPDWEFHMQLNLIDSFMKLLRDEENGEDYSLPIALDLETKSKIDFVVRMLIFILEQRQNLFVKTLTSFINRYETAALILSDVWEILTQSAIAEGISEILPNDVIFSKIVKSWLYHSGHPFIRVERNKDGTLMVYQEPVLFPGVKKTGLCWPIPFEVITKNQPQAKRKKVRHWLTCSEPKVFIPVLDVDANDWIIVTSQLHVPGRVHYDTESWSLIQKLFLSKEAISNIDDFTKIQLIHDMFALAENSYLNYDFVLSTMKYIANEIDYKCWYVAHQELRRTRSRWIGTSLFEPFQEFLRILIKPIFIERIVKIDDFLANRYLNDMLGRIIIQAACTFELPECKEYSENLLNNLVNNSDYERTNPISEFLQESFYCMAMKNADDKKLEFLLKKYKEKPNETWILRALGCSRNPHILKKFLNWALTVNNSKKSPRLSLEVFEILSLSDVGYQIIISYFKILRFSSVNRDTALLKEFIAALGSDIIIEDFLIIAMKATKKTKDMDLLFKFSNTLRSQKTGKVKSKKAQKPETDEARLKKDEKTSEAKLQAIGTAKNFILWFEKEEKGLLQYLTLCIYN